MGRAISLWVALAVCSCAVGAEKSGLAAVVLGFRFAEAPKSPAHQGRDQEQVGRASSAWQPPYVIPAQGLGLLQCGACGAALPRGVYGQN